MHRSFVGVLRSAQDSLPQDDTPGARAAGRPRHSRRDAGATRNPARYGVVGPWGCGEALTGGGADSSTTVPSRLRRTIGSLRWRRAARSRSTFVCTFESLSDATSNSFWPCADRRLANPTVMFAPPTARALS